MDAIAIANYFIDKSNKEGYAKLTLLRLIKYVYIAHGFALAILKRTIINKRFDRVEAWKYGPVIPSVYHSFKHNQNNIIVSKASVLMSEDNNGEMYFSVPSVPEYEKDVIRVLDFVWERYKNKTTFDLIALLHNDDTPWKYCYREGENIEIPDEMTAYYYTLVVENATQSK